MACTQGGSYLLRRGTGFSVRIRLPVALARATGRLEAVRSLRTRDPRMARALAAAIAVRVDGLWPDMAEAQENEVGRLIEAWFKRELDRAWRDFSTGASVRALVSDIEDPAERRARQGYALRTLADDRLDRLSAAFRVGDYGDGIELAREIVRELDAPIPEDDRRFTVLAREMMRAEGHVADAQVHWSEGQEQFTPDWKPELPEALFPKPKAVELPQAVAAAAPAAPSPIVKPISGVTVSELFQRYTSEARMKPKSKADFGTAVRRFIDLHGDLDLHQIEKRHVVTFKDMLLQLPSRMLDADRKLTAPELVERYRSRPSVPRLSPKTVNEKGIAAIKACFGYGVKNDLMPANVASNVAAQEDRVKRPSRLPYDMTDLRAIFSQDTFLKGERPVAGGGEAAVWLPTLALYTGARLNELGTLTVGDVCERDGVRFLFIRDGKTTAARRKVPIHSELIRLGFLDYVKGRGSRPDAKLFPGIGTTGLDEEATSPFSQWWGRYARKVVPDTRKVFHSFRHTVKLTLRNAGVDKTLRDAVMGHDADDVAENYGLDEDGEGYALPALAEAIERISYPGLIIAIAIS